MSGSDSKKENPGKFVAITVVAVLVVLLALLTFFVLDRPSSPPALDFPTASRNPTISPSPLNPQDPPTPSAPTERQRYLDRQLSLLRDGHLVYRPPSPMRVNDWRRVVVRVSDPSAPPDFKAGLPGSGPVTTRDVRVGSDLIADLAGPDFTVVRVGGDDGRRTLATGTFAEWQWDVRPLRSGQRSLSLVLHVRLTEGGSPVDVRTFVEEVSVQVNVAYSVSQWVKHYWQATGLTVPVIAAAVWAVIRWRRQATAPATVDSGPADSPPSNRTLLRHKRSDRPRPKVRRGPR